MEPGTGSIFKCHECPELPLNVIRVHVNIVVYFGNTVKLDNLATSDNLHPRWYVKIFTKFCIIGNIITSLILNICRVSQMNYVCYKTL